MRFICILLLTLACGSAVRAGDCFETARVVAPAIAEKVRRVYDSKLAEAKTAVEQDPNDADALIWLGRRTAYLGEYRESIRIFARGASLFPNDARFLRHRGHRLITLRCFDDAILDLESAAKLVRGKPDEVEPDGLPNARNTPTSTLKTNIYYHLGLAYYLRRDFKRALAAYRKCAEYSKNPDMLVAAKHWEYMTLRRLNRKRAAEKAVAPVADGLEIIENDDYYKLIRLYQGKITADELERSIGGNADSLGNASLGYGLGNWYFYIGETEKGLAVFRLITAGNQWASFGFIAAEAELTNPRGQK
jgi:tetratricopeptide (TPR) repeat protein